MDTKKIIISLLIALLIVTVNTVGFCTNTGGGAPDSAIHGDLLDPSSYGGTSSNTSTNLQNQAGQIIGIVQVVAMAIAVIMLIWLAIKYIAFNRRQNSKNITGGDVARQILDKNGLKHIKVSTFGSLLLSSI